MHGRYYSVWPNLENSVFKINLFISYILEYVLFIHYTSLINLDYLVVPWWQRNGIVVLGSIEFEMRSF